jgi:putative ABC transport system permease protein
MRFKLDQSALVYTLVLSVATGVAFGIVPALQVSGSSPHATLKEGGRAVAGGLGGSRLRGLLVVAEVALSLVLLVGASLLIKSFLSMVNEDPGFDTSRFITLRAHLPGTRYDCVHARAAMFEHLRERMAETPGVEDVAFVNLLPLSEYNSSTRIEVEGRSIAAGEEPAVESRVISSNYFAALGLPLRSGRTFTSREMLDSVPVTIISETMARRFWPQESAIGKRIRFAGDTANPWLTIVGIAPDSKMGIDSPKQESRLYLPYPQAPWNPMSFVVRASGNPARLATPLRQAVWALDRDVPVFQVFTMDELRERSAWGQRLLGWVFGALAAIALVLAAVGVYGVIAHAVTQRTHEIGVRVALGAQPRDILRLVVGHGVVLAATGVALGLAGALAISRLLASLLYGVSTSDPVVFALVSVFLGSVALLASLIPARRAARVDPMVALRDE